MFSPRQTSPLLTSYKTPVISHTPLASRRIQRYIALLTIGIILLFWTNSWTGKGTSSAPSAGFLSPSKKRTDDMMSSSMKLGRKDRAIRLNGFDLCKELNNAKFDPATYIYPLKGTVFDKNPTHIELVAFVENEAMKVQESVRSFFKDPLREDLRLFSCYAAAEGATPLSNLTDQRFLVELDGPSYFTDVLPMIPQPSIISGPRRHFKIAYLLMCHDPGSFQNIKDIIDILDDGLAIILIHVDLRKESFRASIAEWLDTRKSKEGSQQNVFLAQKSFRNIWGHVSLVHTQLSGFWELYDMADWDYVINLSAFDYPLKRNSDIYDILSSPEYKGKNWVSCWGSSVEMSVRILRPHILGDSNEYTVNKDEMGLHWWPFHNYKAYKQHQWMMLHRDFVNHLRNDADALNLLAFMAFTSIPDEMYFAIVLKNHPYYSQKIVSQSKRYLRFESGSPHPAWLHLKDRHYFQPKDGEPKYFFIRKVNAAKSPDLIEWIRNNHLSVDSGNFDCSKEQIFSREGCLIKYVSEISEPTIPGGNRKSIILIAINKAFYNVAMNLRCSMEKLGIKNIVFWSLDFNTHIRLMDEGHLSYYDSGAFSQSSHMKWHDNDLTKLMRQKIRVIKRFIKAGFDTWYLDADNVVLKDFRKLAQKTDSNAQILYGMDERDEFSDYSKRIPHPAGGMMYFKSGDPSVEFLDAVQAVLDAEWLEDQEAADKVLNFGEVAEVVGKGSTLWVSSPKVTVEFIPQKQFINGHIFFSNDVSKLKSFEGSDFYVVHANSVKDAETALKWKNLWTLDDNAVCLKHQI